MRSSATCVLVRICPRICFCGESISKNAFRRFESVYRPEMPEMHLQNFEKLQSRKKRRNLSKSSLFSFFVPASKSDTHHGRDSWTRTNACRSQSPVPLPTWLYPFIFTQILYHAPTLLSIVILKKWECTKM